MQEQNSQEFNQISKSISDLVTINKQLTKEQKVMRDEFINFKEEVNTQLQGI